MERENQRFTRSLHQKGRLKRLLNQSSSSDFFIESCLEASPGTSVTSAELYRKYEAFCDQQVFNPIDEETFYRRIRKPIFRLYHSIPGEVDLQADANNRPDRTKARLKGYKQLRVKPESHWPSLSSGAVADSEFRKFCVKDIPDPRGLITKLKDKTNPISMWLEQYLRKETKAGLQALDDKTDHLALIRKIIADLNMIVSYPLIYDRERFAEVKLRELTRTLLCQNPETEVEVKTLNKLLLEDAFPGELIHVTDTEGLKQVDNQSPPDTTHG